MSVSVAFEKAKADGRAALVGYLPAGFPDVDGSIAALEAMVAAGCDVIEVGLPYSDPIMDGPIIQSAVQQALDAGFRLDDEAVDIYGFEAGGDGYDTGRHAATIHAGERGVLHGARTFVLQDEDGQTTESHSISAGLDYPGVGPQHAHLADVKRATYLPVTDAEAMDAMALLARTEGIIPAIESAHALAGAVRVAEERPGQTILVNLSGRGDKDMGTALEYFKLGSPDEETGS